MKKIEEFFNDNQEELQSIIKMMKDALVNMGAFVPRLRGKDGHIEGRGEHMEQLASIIHEFETVSSMPVKDWKPLPDEVFKQTLLTIALTYRNEDEKNNHIAPEWLDDAIYSVASAQMFYDEIKEAMRKDLENEQDEDR